MPASICRTCDGNGFVPRTGCASLARMWPKDLTWSKKCPKCNGTGIIDSEAPAKAQPSSKESSQSTAIGFVLVLIVAGVIWFVVSQNQRRGNQSPPPPPPPLLVGTWRGTGSGPGWNGQVMWVVKSNGTMDVNWTWSDPRSKALVRRFMPCSTTLLGNVIEAKERNGARITYQIQWLGPHEVQWTITRADDPQIVGFKGRMLRQY